MGIFMAILCIGVWAIVALAGFVDVDELNRRSGYGEKNQDTESQV